MGCGGSDSTSQRILIKGGTVVNAHHQQVADVFIDNGIVTDVKPNIKVLFRCCMVESQILNWSDVNYGTN